MKKVIVMGIYSIIRNFDSKGIKLAWFSMELLYSFGLSESPMPTCSIYNLGEVCNNWSTFEYEYVPSGKPPNNVNQRLRFKIGLLVVDVEADSEVTVLLRLLLLRAVKSS